MLPLAQLLKKRVREAEGRFAEFLGYRVGSPLGLLPQEGRDGRLLLGSGRNDCFFLEEML